MINLCVWGDGNFILHICLAAHQKVTNYLIRSGNFIPFSKVGLKPFPALGTVSGKCKRNSSFFFRGTLTHLYCCCFAKRRGTNIVLRWYQSLLILIPSLLHCLCSVSIWIVTGDLVFWISDAKSPAPLWSVGDFYSCDEWLQSHRKMSSHEKVSC